MNYQTRARLLIAALLALLAAHAHVHVSPAVVIVPVAVTVAVTAVAALLIVRLIVVDRRSGLRSAPAGSR